MGCFDTVVISCPSCKTKMKFQSKAGDCRSDVFTPENAPLRILAALEYESSEGRLECKACCNLIEIQVQKMVTVRHKDPFFET